MLLKNLTSDPMSPRLTTSLKKDFTIFTEKGFIMNANFDKNVEQSYSAFMTLKLHNHFGKLFGDVLYYTYPMTQ